MATEYYRIIVLWVGRDLQKSSSLTPLSWVGRSSTRSGHPKCHINGDSLKEYMDAESANPGDYWLVKEIRF